MEMAEKSKEATSSESFSGTFGCQYGQMVYKHRSQLNAGLILTPGV